MVKETNKNLKTVNTEQTEIQLVWLSEQDTQYFAERLSKQLSLLAEPVNLFIELHGDLGSGKTTLVRYLLQALGVTGRIKSPTYAIVESYDEVRDASLKPLPVWHFDFYRFKDPLEWEEAGFRDMFAGPGIKLVEWPEMAESELPLADIAILIIANSDNSRTATVLAKTPSGNKVLSALS